MKRPLTNLRVVISLWDVEGMTRASMILLKNRGVCHVDEAYPSGYLYSFELDTSSLVTLCEGFAALQPVFQHLAENPACGGVQFLMRGEQDNSAWFKIEDRMNRGSMNAPTVDAGPAFARIEALKELVNAPLKA